MNPSAGNKNYEAPRLCARMGSRGEYRDEAKAEFTLKALQAKGDYLTYEQDYSTREEGKMAFEPQSHRDKLLWDWAKTGIGRAPGLALIHIGGGEGASTGKGCKR